MVYHKSGSSYRASGGMLDSIVTDDDGDADVGLSVDNVLIPGTSYYSGMMYNNGFSSAPRVASFSYLGYEPAQKYALPIRNMIASMVDIAQSKISNLLPPSYTSKTNIHNDPTAINNVA